jgi:hypothetical protein
VGKALNIKDTATYDLLAELAVEANVSVNEAIEEALSLHLTELNKSRAETARSWLEKLKSHGVDADFMENRWQPAIETML